MTWAIHKGSQRKNVLITGRNIHPECLVYQLKTQGSWLRLLCYALPYFAISTLFCYHYQYISEIRHNTVLIWSSLVFWPLESSTDKVNTWVLAYFCLCGNQVNCMDHTRVWCQMHWYTRLVSVCNALTYSLLHHDTATDVLS